MLKVMQYGKFDPEKHQEALSPQRRRREEAEEKVECRMIEKGELIYSTKVVVDTLSRAERMKENFYGRPEGIYKATLALLAGNVNFLLD